MMKIIFAILVCGITMTPSMDLAPKTAKFGPLDEGRYYFQNSILIPKSKRIKVT